jgi:hypothetical protein
MYCKTIEQKIISKLLLVFAALFFIFSCTNPSLDNKGSKQETYWSYLAEMNFPEAYPTAEATEVLYNEMLFQRASQSVIWSMPAMSLWYMKKGSEAQFGEGSHIFPFGKIV